MEINHKLHTRWFVDSDGSLYAVVEFEDSGLPSSGMLESSRVETMDDGEEENHQQAYARIDGVDYPVFGVWKISGKAKAIGDCRLPEKARKKKTERRMLESSEK